MMNSNKTMTLKLNSDNPQYKEYEKMFKRGVILTMQYNGNPVQRVKVLSKRKGVIKFEVLGMYNPTLDTQGEPR